jgi:HSP20 family protein
MTQHWLGEIENIHDEMERLSNAMRGIPPTKGQMLQKQFRNPIVNQFVTKDHVVTEIELPGVEKNDIQLNVNDNFAEIKVEHKEEAEQKEKGYYKYESHSQNFFRHIPFPTDVKTSEGVATFKNGILRLEMPKTKVLEGKDMKRLEIQ